MSILRSLGFSFLLLISFSSFALNVEEISRFTEVENKQIARDLDAMSFLMKLGDEVEAKKHLPLSDQAWAKDLSDSTMELLKRAYADGPEERTLIEKFRSMFKWDKLWGYTKKLGQEAVSFGRFQGLSAAVIIMVSGPSDLWVPVLATALGKPALIPIMAVLPDTQILLGADMLIKNYYSRKRIIEGFGSRKAYNEFAAARKKVLLDLGARSDDYFHPLKVVGEEIETIVIARSGMVKKFLGRLGLREEGLTLNKVKVFLTKENLIEDPFVRSILKQDLPEEIRAGMILSHLTSERGDEVAESVFDTFGENVRRVRITPEKAALWDAYQSLVKAKNITEIKEALEMTSSHVSTKQLAQLWKEKLLPTWSKNIDGLSIFEFRRLVTGFDKVYGSLLSESTAETFDQTSKEKILNYLDRVSPAKEICNDALRAI
jgi:hypothetical protein